MQVENYTVSTSYGNLAGDMYHAAKKENSSDVIFIHGGGLRGRLGWKKVREEFAMKGISSYAFDFVGHGETGGDITTTNLAGRVDQLVQIVKQISPDRGVTLVASSMGGYIALASLARIKVTTLILVAPAVYAKEAFLVPFGPLFSSILRKQNSWMTTDAWEYIASFTGNLLIIQAEKDQIIPEGVVEGIYTHATSAYRRGIVLCKEATHPLTDWLGVHQKDLTAVVSASIPLILERSFSDILPKDPSSLRGDKTSWNDRTNKQP